MRLLLGWVVIVLAAFGLFLLLNGCCDWVNGQCNTYAPARTPTVAQ